MHKNVLLLFTLLLLSPLPCHGHKILVFAWVEKDIIRGEASFQRGRKARHVDIFIQTDGGQPPLASTKTDESGNFSLPLPDFVKDNPTDILVIADSGDGHRNEWLIEKTEFENTAEVEKLSESSRAVNNGNLPAEQDSAAKRAMAEKRVDEISITDILAGLSIIFGLAGLTLLLRKKRK